MTRKSLKKFWKKSGPLPGLRFKLICLVSAYHTVPLKFWLSQTIDLGRDLFNLPCRILFDFNFFSLKKFSFSIWVSNNWKKPFFMRQIPYIHNEMKIGKIKHCGIISRTQLPDLIGNHWTTLNVCFTRYDQNQMRCCNVRYLPNW